MWSEYRKQSAVESIDSLIDSYDSVRDSALVTRISETFAFLLSFKVFEEYNVDPVTNNERVRSFAKILTRNPLEFSVKFGVSLLKLVRFALVNGKEFILTGDVGKLMSDDNSLVKWISCP